MAMQVLGEALRFDGRILFLSQNAKVVERQLRGHDVSLAEAQPLCTDISTDEITPAWVCYYFDETLGEFPYVGLKCGSELPVSRGAVKSAGFRVMRRLRQRWTGRVRQIGPDHDHSAINRNFPGRSGPGQVWLASPSTVAASAIGGHIVSPDQLKSLVMATKMRCANTLVWRALVLELANRFASFAKMV